MQRLWFLLGLGCISSSGAADVFRCPNEQGGAPIITNVQSKGCSRLVVGLPSEPEPAARSGASSSRPSGGGNAKGPTPADFPRVDPATQRSRDDGRRRILDAEVASEQKALDEAKRTGAKDRVALHERNLEALRKEIGNLK